MKPGSEILIVDDDPRNIFALSAVLRAKGYQCRSVTGMKEAFALMRAEKNIGIILLDMMMPSIDGYQAIPMIRATEGYEQVPVIAVTAQAMSGDRERCIDAGADDYISKPVNIDELQEILQSYQ